ncbi:MAG: aminotransferase class III-fold pyridoxal phosphate-dependent enzyme [Acidobacteria bacterium]|nr:aminotransferase class III-fold pyridoxal phosphate-dependent enzyme [Acidobacteriota bacterium]
MSRDEILLAAKEHLFPAVIHYFDEPLVLDHAKDQYVWDADGRQYLDFFGGIVTVSVGHCNDKVRAAVHAQVDKLMHVSTLFATEPQAALAKTIAEKTPGRALSQSFFTNSGTEANETAVSLARMHTGSSEIVALRHSYHGRTEAGRGMTGQKTWRGPLPPAAGYSFIHNAYCYRCPFGQTYPSCELRCAHDAKEAIETTTSGRVAALIAEPIQGSGGFITPPKEYFPIVVDIVKQHGGIFISDEVQTGWGRTGKWFGIENWGVTPDVMTFAKGLGNGLPIGATTAKQEVAQSLKFLTLSTFGGNPVTTAAAKAVIDFVEEENLLANCDVVGQRLRERLLELQAKHPLIGDVRGMGLMQAIELVRDRETKEPAPQETTRLMDAARQEGLLIGKGGLYGNVIRISPPMNISAADVDEFARLLDLAFARVAA